MDWRLCSSLSAGHPQESSGSDGWRSVEQSRKAGYFIPETHAVYGWDKLLSEMELTEEQALMECTCPRKGTGHNGLCCHRLSVGVCFRDVT